MNEDHRKHLDFIQQVITRSNGNSFQLKGWTVTIVAALSALSAGDAKPQFAWIAGGAVVIFWLLDAYYLRLERLYRGLYDHLRVMTDAQIDDLKLPYCMQPQSFGVHPEHLLKTAFRPTVLIFHLPLFACALLIRFLAFLGWLTTRSPLKLASRAEARALFRTELVTCPPPDCPDSRLHLAGALFHPISSIRERHGNRSARDLQRHLQLCNDSPKLR